MTLGKPRDGNALPPLLITVQTEKISEGAGKCQIILPMMTTGERSIHPTILSEWKRLWDSWEKSKVMVGGAGLEVIPQSGAWPCSI